MFYLVGITFTSSITKTIRVYFFNPHSSLADMIQAKVNAVSGFCIGYYYPTCPNTGHIRQTTSAVQDYHIFPCLLVALECATAVLQTPRESSEWRHLHQSTDFDDDEDDDDSIW